MVRSRDVHRDGRTRRQFDIDEQRLCADARHRTARVPATERQFPGDDLDPHACGVGEFRDGGRGDIPVLGGPHLLGGRQVQPQLEAAHQTAFLLRHLRVDDAATGRHPLHVARAEMSTVAEVILVQHVPREHVGHSLETAVRMGREPLDVFVRAVAAELIEHEERIEPRERTLTETAPQGDARTVRGALGVDDALQHAHSRVGVGSHEARVGYLSRDRCAREQMIRTMVPDTPPNDRPHIVIVGGGAGGLELATRLGDTLGRRGRAKVTLIERGRTHFWKPHLHELAAGSVDLDVHELDYLAQSHWHGFKYRYGEMIGLDRAAREVLVGPVMDEEHGEEIVPARRVAYDLLVLAVGSNVNDFGTPGVIEHAMALDSTAQADRFHRRLVNAFLRAHAQTVPLRRGQLDVAIVGAGATGVELAAELHNATRELVSFSLDNIDPDKHIRLHLIEASPRILPALPERISIAARRMLDELNVEVHCDARVAEVLPQAVRLADGRVIDAAMVVWAAGVKAAPFLAKLGIATNALNQVKVDARLRSVDDPDIYALGDCAAVEWAGHPGRLVPPRAQAAHQQAMYLVKALRRRLAGKTSPAWRYRDFGSLVSLGEYSTVGNLMGNFVGGNLWLEGLFARWMYQSLYKMHEIALHGWWKTSLTTLARLIARQTEPRVKLH